MSGLERLMGWARMSFKLAKSRSLFLKKGKVVVELRFSISGTPIPTISEKPVKSLGKFFDSSLRDTASIKNTCEELEGWLKNIDKTGLPGKGWQSRPTGSGEQRWQWSKQSPIYPMESW